MKKNQIVAADCLHFQPCRWRRRISGLGAVIGLVLLSSTLVLPLEALERTWVGSSGYWNDPGNWSPFGIPQDGDSLVFEDNGSANVMTNNVAALSVAGMLFHKGKTLYGTSLTTTGPIVQDNTDGNSVNLNIPALFLGNSVTVASQRNAWGLTFNCQVLLNGHSLYALTTDSAGGIVRFQSGIFGDGTFICAGGTNIYMGDYAYPRAPTRHVIVTAGQLNVGYNYTNAIGESLEIGPGGTVNFMDDNQIDWQASVLIRPGGTLRLNDHFNYFRNLEMQGGVLECGPAGSILLSDDIRVNATNETAVIKGRCTISTTTGSAYDPHPRLMVNGTIYPALDIQAIVFGLGGFSKSGSAAMYLSVSNYFLGELVLSNGIVEARNNYALGKDYINAGGDIKGVRLAGGTLLLRNASVPGREMYVDRSVNSSGSFGLPGAFITCVGSCGWSGDVTLSTNLNVVGDITFSGAISGPGGLAFFGGGTSSLGGSNANSYTGVTLVRCPLLLLAKGAGVKAYAGALEVGGGAGGTCEVRWSNSNQNPNAQVTLYDDGLLNLNNFSEDLGPITFTGGGIQTGSGLLGVNGLITANASSHLGSISGRINLPAGLREFRVQGNALAGEGLSVSAAIEGSGQLTKTGSGMLQLSGASTYTGLTLITEGWLSASTPTALGAGDPGTIVNEGATLQLNSLGSTPMQERINIRGEGVSGSGALDVVGFAQLRTLFPTLYACLNLTTNATINVAGAASKLVLDGIVSGSGTLTKIGAGTLVFTNSVANTYSGTTIVREGAMELRKPNNTPSIPGPLVLGPGTPSAQGVVRLYQTGGAPATSMITANAYSVLDLNGNNLNVTQLVLNDGGSVQTGAGTLQFLGGGTITIGTSNGPVQGLRQAASISGKILLPSFDTVYIHVLNYGPAPLTFEPELSISANISGTSSLYKDGGGALRLTGNNTFDGTSQVYSGEVDVMEGTVIAGSATALGGISGQTYVAGGASLALINGITIANESLLLNTTNNAAIDNRGGNNTWTGPIQLYRDSTINVAQDWELNCSGIISGTGSLTKWGAGTWRVSGNSANSYSGDTMVNAGLAILAKPTAVNAIPGWVIIGENSGGGAPATVRNASSYQIFSGIVVNSQGFYDVNLQTENTDYLALNGNAKVDTSGGYLILKPGAPVDVTPGTNTTATMYGFVRLDAGTHVFTVGSGNSSTNAELLAYARFDLVLNSAGIQKAGPGKMQLMANNTYTGITTISGGTLQVDGSQPQSQVQILGARLQGSGTVGQITFGGNAAERLAPGSSPGILTCSNFNANAVGGGTVEIELNGASPGTGYDQIVARGTVNLNALKLSGSLGFMPPAGAQFVIVDNDGSDSVTGTFVGLPQNGNVYIGGQLFQINYFGGTGNDVVLTKLVTPPLPSLSMERGASNSIRISWPTNGPSFRLVSSTNLSSTNWIQASPLPIVVGANYVVTNSTSLTANFYRLVTP